MCAARKLVLTSKRNLGSHENRHSRRHEDRTGMQEAKTCEPQFVLHSPAPECLANICRILKPEVNARAHASSVLHDKLIVFGGVRDKVGVGPVGIGEMAEGW